MKSYQKQVREYITARQYILARRPMAAECCSSFNVDISKDRRLQSLIPSHCVELRDFVSPERRFAPQRTQ